MAESFKYKGYTPVKTGDKVELLINDEWVAVRVKWCLASQFTVKYAKRDWFYFYADKGATWRRISE